MVEITSVELGLRLKTAREASGRTQEAVAQHLGIPRSGVAQIEAGKRKVAAHELIMLADLYGRNPQDFHAETFDEHPFAALFRAQPHVEMAPETMNVINKSLEMGRQMTELEQMLGLNRSSAASVCYLVPMPNTRFEAIQQGETLAQEERRRLALGLTPLGDMSEFLESQDVRTAVVPMDDSISGITLRTAKNGVLVVINKGHSRKRRRFSHAHEYAHVLFDIARERGGMLSQEDNRSSLVEVRANAFAAAFLMPAEGVRQFMAGLGKGRGSRVQVDLFDEEIHTPVEVRSDPGSQEVQLYEVALLAHHFGVSLLSAAYRLKSLKLISESDVARLKAENARHGIVVEQMLGIYEDPKTQEEERNRFGKKLFVLALEAYRRGLLSHDKLLSLSTLFDVKGSDMLDFILGSAPSTKVVPLN